MKAEKLLELFSEYVEGDKAKAVSTLEIADYLGLSGTHTGQLLAHLTRMGKLEPAYKPKGEPGGIRRKWKLK